MVKNTPKIMLKTGLGGLKSALKHLKCSLKHPEKRKKGFKSSKIPEIPAGENLEKGWGEKIQGKIQLDMAKKTSKITLKMAK